MKRTSSKAKKSYAKPSTEGARQLRAICERGTVAAVAAKIRVTEGAIRHYASGRRSPGEVVILRLAHAYSSMAPELWTTRAGKAGASAPAEVTSAASPATSPPSLARAGLTNRERLAAIVEQLEAQIAKCGADVPRNHLASLYGQLQAAVHKLSKLDGDGELTLGAILRSRAWGEIDAMLSDVLRKYPGAAEDLVAMLDPMKNGRPHVPGS